ncbi:MAG TPA: jacalin-like lectin [Pseudomonas sp.]|nr:jacalin-like lectin [Pseudomonas sp.]
MSSTITHQLVNEFTQDTYNAANAISGFGLSSNQFKQLSEMGEGAWNSILSVVVHDHGVAAPAGIEIKSPDETDFSRTQTILNTVGISLATICGVIAAVLGLLAIIPGAQPLAVIAAWFALLAVGIGVLIAFLSWLLVPELHSGIEFGGKGGALFHDELDASKGGEWVFRDYPNSNVSNWEIDRVDLWCGNVLDAIQTHWRGRPGSPVAGASVAGKKLGGGGGQCRSFQLEAGETIQAINVKAGEVVDSIRFHTNKRISDIYGGSGGNREKLLEGPVIGLLGRAGNVIDAIGVQKMLHTHQTVAYGGNGGVPFLYNLAEMKRLIRINVWHGAYIDAIELYWENNDGAIVSAPMYGGHFIGGVAGTRGTVEFVEGETLSKIEVRSDAYVDRLVFHTSHGKEHAFGGEGGEQQPTIELAGRKLLGIVGRYTRYVDQFGVILG